MCSFRMYNVSMAEMNASTSFKRLHRSETNQIVGGVAAGIADYFEVDPLIIRILFIFLTVFGGTGIFLYIMLWLIVPGPNAPDTSLEATFRTNAEEIKERIQTIVPTHLNSQSAPNPTSRTWLGWFLLLLGVVFLGDQLGWFHVGSIFSLWPIGLIVVGYLILNRHE